MAHLSYVGDILALLPKVERTRKSLFFLTFWLSGFLAFWLCGTVNAKITGNALFSYDLIKENGKWSGESEQRINLGMRGRAGLESLLGLNFGVVRRGKEWSFLGGVIPTYALNLQGKHYNLSSGYSVRTYRDIINSRMYENLRVFLPNLPTFKLSYAKQGTRDIQKEHKTNSTGSNIEFGLEDEIGPFRITVNRREYSLKDLVRGPESEVKSSDISGDVDFTYSYRRLFSLNGRYGIGQLITERGMTGEIKGKTRDFSLDFRISPIPTIALSGGAVGRREQRGGFDTGFALLNPTLPSATQLKPQSKSPTQPKGWKQKTSSDSLTNRLQLMLMPVEGIRLNATYSKSDASRNEGWLLSNESKSLVLNVEPWQNLAFSGNLGIYDSFEQEKRLFTLRRNSFDLRAEPIEGLRISSRLDLSKTTDFVGGFSSSRNNVTTRLEAMLTENLRTDISYDWQKLNKRLRGIIDEESQHKVAFAVNYSFARMLNFNFRFGRNISSQWKGNTTFLSCGLNYQRDKSYVNFRYNRVSGPGRSPLSLREKQWTTQTFTVELGQKVGQDTDLRLSYESRLGGGEFGYRGLKRISFRVNIRF